MMTDDLNETLIAYVEGQLSPSDRSGFEAKLQSSPALQSQLELLRKMDDSLKHAFAAPGFVKVDFDAARAQAAAGARQTSAPWKRWAGIAGAAIAAMVLIVVLLQLNAPKNTVSMIYDNEVKAGFQPTHICANDQDFADYTKKYFGVPMVAQSDSTITILGWTYASEQAYKDLGLTKEARIILCNVEGQKVMLFLDKNDVRGPRLDSAAKGRLHVFDVNIKGVHVFEVTPLEKPAAANRLKPV